jgi:hypothetical protein
VPSAPAASPSTGRAREPPTSDTWKTTTNSTATARSESMSGKRGLPGGGATAGDGEGEPAAARAPVTRAKLAGD